MLLAVLLTGRATDCDCAGGTFVSIILGEGEGGLKNLSISKDRGIRHYSKTSCELRATTRLLCDYCVLPRVFIACRAAQVFDFFS